LTARLLGTDLKHLLYKRKQQAVFTLKKGFRQGLNTADYSLIGVKPLNTEAIKLALEEVRPHLQADGGDVELVEVTDDGVVKVRLMGACAGCPMRQMTLKGGIENFIRKKVPEIKTVEAV
jgi:Fe-S cluster biogenesis protein NfuA